MRAYSVEYSPIALEDLRAIYSYIATELKADQAAKQQGSRIRTQIKALSRMPERYHKVDWEPWQSMGMRKLPVDNYVVYYLSDVENRRAIVVRIVYRGRNIEEIIREDNNGNTQ